VKIKNLAYVELKFYFTLAVIQIAVQAVLEV